MDKDDFAVWDLEEDEVDDIIDDDEDEPRAQTKNRPKRREIGKPAAKRPQNTGERAKGQRPGKSGFLKSRTFTWLMRIGVVMAVLMLLFLPLEPLERFREDSGIDKLRNLLRPFREFPEWVEANMSVSYDLQISSGTADEIRIRTAVPFDIMDNDTSFRIQNVSEVSMFPDPVQSLPDYDRSMNVISGWKLEDEWGTFHFKAEFSVKLYSYQWDITEDESGTVSDIPQDKKDRYLDDEWVVLDADGNPIDRNFDGVPDYYRYHPSAPTIKNAAESLTKGEPTVYGKVKAIYEWIEDHFNYTTNEQRSRDQAIYGQWPKYPLGSLADWYGDCDDQSLLMASMCRSVGIPAWLEIGYLYDPMAKSWGGHGWFNVVIPLKDRGSVVAPIDPVNHEFLFRDPYRITDWIDTGGEVMDEEGNLVFNLDHYYNFFKIKKGPSVDHNIRITTQSIGFEEHGRVRQYVDQKMEPGNLPGSQEGFDQLPFPAVALAAAAALPVILGRKRVR